MNTLKYLFPIAFLFLLWGLEDAHAISTCNSSSLPSTFSINSIQVRQEGETDFHDIDSSNFCYTGQDLAVGAPAQAGGLSHKLYIVYFTTVVTKPESDFPAGTEFKISITNLDADYSLGEIMTRAEEARAVYGDEKGGSPDDLEVVVKSYDTRQKAVSGQTSCSAGAELLGAQLSVSAIPKKEVSSQKERVINAVSSGNSGGVPQLGFDSDSVQFSLDYDSYGCHDSSKSYDAFVDCFFPKVTLARSGLTEELLTYLDDDMLPLLFSGSASQGMTVTSFTVRKSYGEKQSLDGLPTSSDYTGLVIRMESANSGWSSKTSSLRDQTFLTASSSSGIRIKPAARNAIKTCRASAKGKKLKKGYSFKKKGNNIACQKNTKKK